MNRKREWTLIAFSLGSGLIYGLTAAAITVPMSPLALQMGGMAGTFLGACSCLFVVPFLRETNLRRSLPLVFICTLGTGLVAAPFLLIMAGVVALVVEFWACRAAARLFHQPADPLACPNCGYSQRGLKGGQCPECGRPFTPDELKH